MAELPAGTDRNRLVIVRPKDVPEGGDPKDLPTHIVGAAWLQSEQGAGDFEFVRFEGESEEQAADREAAAAAAAATAAVEPAKPVEAPKGDASQRRNGSFE